MDSKLEKLLETVSPRLLLDNYWEILNQIKEITSGSKGKRYFTLSELKKKILLKINGSMLINYRMYLRSFTVIKKVIDELVNSGLFGNIGR